MTRDELNSEYFKWMYKLVCSTEPSRRRSYWKLLQHLHDTEFVYVIVMDSNREEDGIDLRYRFAYENSYNGSIISTYLDDHPCSVLEMLIALATRCEECIMDDPDIGNRTGKWFWGMIKNLGLGSMSDERFDECYIDKVVERFLKREYNRNGNGGLFTVKHCERDLRSVEIWYQMCWYLDEILGGK